MEGKANNIKTIQNYIEDTTPPELSNFNLDMDTGIIVLSFDEPLNQSTFNFSLFTIQDNPVMITPSDSVELSVGSEIPFSFLTYETRFRYYLSNDVVNSLVICLLTKGAWPVWLLNKNMSAKM